MNVKFSLTVTVEGTSLEDVDNGLVQAAGERLRARMLNPPAGPLGVPTLKTGPALASAPPFVTTAYHAPDSKPAVMPVPEAVRPYLAKAEEPVPKKRGRKPGQKMAPYKKKGEEENEEESNETRGYKVGPHNGGGQEEDEENDADQSNDESGDNGDEEAAESLVERAPQAAQKRPQASQSIKAVDTQVKAVDTQVKAAKTATVDDTVQALKLVNSTFNVDKARECLAHFNVKRCGDLPEDERAAFVEHCEQLCGG